MAKLKIMNPIRLFTFKELIHHRMLNQTNIQKNHNKFYEAKLEKSTNGDYRVITRFGRVGDEGKIDYRYFEGAVTEDEAVKEYEKLLNTKIKGGYSEIDVDTEGKKDSKVNLKTLEPLDKLIMQLYDEAIARVKQQIETPLGKLTENQINKTRAILDELYTAIDSKYGIDTLEELSSQLYTNLPQRSPSRLERLPVIQTFRELERQIELLDILKSLVKVQGALDSDAKARYEATGATIKHLDLSKRECKRIEKYISGSVSNHHNINVHVKNIFSVGIKGEEKRFNPDNLKVMELFHGSRSANLLNILTSGLLIKPKTAAHTGSMFGNGIYFASESSKSTQYAQKWADNKYDTAFLLVCDVAVGNIKDYTDAQPHLNKAPQGYHCVRGVKGRSLLHDEYIVYNTNQVKIKYIVEFATSRKR